MAKAPPKKVTKEEANYRASEDLNFRCGNCIHFEPYDEVRAFGYCYLVLGKMSSLGLCNLWEPDPRQEPGDKLYKVYQGKPLKAIRVT